GTTPSFDQPNSPVRPDVTPEQIVSDPTPLGPVNPTPPPTTENKTVVDGSESIKNDSVPKGGKDKTKVQSNSISKVSGAPKTGWNDLNIMIKNFLIYGTMLLLLMALVEEYSRKRNS
ncbi:MAG: hypothetical protein Q4D77_04965, partial [Peptostreptococcaceae bacterium]|nr:hypothetical protein [Peptostreptococcaceae bacterium]